MAKKKVSTATARFERALQSSQQDVYVLRLYVTGATPASQRAVENTKNLCEQYLKGRYRLEVVDVYQQPELAQGVQIVAAPTLVKSMPPPLRRFIGDMSKTDRLLLGLGVEPKT
jgi:circadian clock protein KaiB